MNSCACTELKESRPDGKVCWLEDKCCPNNFTFSQTAAVEDMSKVIGRLEEAVLSARMKG